MALIKKVFPFLILIGLLLYFLLFRPKIYQYQFNLMATQIDLHIVTERYRNVDKIKDGLIVELKRLAKIFSSYDPNSELSFVNQKAFHNEVPLSNELHYVIERAISYGTQSNGLFDPTILPLIRLWSVTKSKDFTIPTQKEISEVLNVVNYQNIILKEKKIRFLKQGMALGLGGISKGYIIDKGIEYLKKEGVSNALLNIGGDMYALGSKGRGIKWNIGIQNPRVNKISAKYIGTLSLENVAVATSGDYERYQKDKAGKRYHHILNPKTGYPSNNSISVTVLAPTAMEADVMATILFILGPDKGLSFLQNHKNVHGLILYENEGEIMWRMSSHFPIQPLMNPTK